MNSYVVAKTQDDLSAKAAVGRHKSVKWCRFDTETVFWQSPERHCQVSCSPSQVRREAEGSPW